MNSLLCESKSGNSLTTQSKGNRFVYVNGEINEDKAKETVERLLELQYEDPMTEITMVVNGPGGEIYSMFAVVDAIDIISPPVRTICLGASHSASAFIFICGTEGRRFMSRHSSIMLHQVSGGTFGTVKDMKPQIEHIRELQDKMIEEMALRSNLSKEEVTKLIDRDCHISIEKAMEMGFCDGVITSLV